VNGITTQFAAPVAAETVKLSARSQISARRSPRWNPLSISILVLAWLILQIGGLFSPGLLDDVDSIYTEVAREMLSRHDYVTPYINGIRFFDKPPLMYWMAAGSMRVFGAHDWAARLPLALGVLALLFAVYALGMRLFRYVSPVEAPDRGGFYAALALATSIGPYLYTRFYIPDILLALWMTLSVHLLLIALDRIHAYRSALLPCIGFAVVMAANVLTKGFIGLVFPLAFVLGYLALTGNLRLLRKLHPISSAAAFLTIAAPWHILAAMRTPPIPMPAGQGLPERGGWAWFYLYNEHIARFLGHRIPHDYGQVPVLLFWALTALWVMPWASFLIPALRQHLRDLHRSSEAPLSSSREAALALLVWAAVVLAFFTFSSRQEYYSLPALPALALMVAGFLSRADDSARPLQARRTALRWTAGLLLPCTSMIALVCGYFALTAPAAAPRTDIASLLAANPEFYNLSLGHVFDLTTAAMGLFRGPLFIVAASMLVAGVITWMLRQRGHSYAANLLLAAAMIVALLGAHEGLARFYPILGSKDLALAINRAGLKPEDRIVLDGELTSGSSLIFYTRHQLHLIHGDVNGLWYGALWPDSPRIFENEASLRRLWSSPQRIFLFTYHPQARTGDLSPFGPVHILASSGGKTVLTNR